MMKEKENIQIRSLIFLGYEFRQRHVKTKNGRFFMGFNPAISDKAKKSIRKEVRKWKMQLKVDKSINDLANIYNSIIRGWINYYGQYFKSEMWKPLRYINYCIIKWVERKYKRYNTRRKAEKWLNAVAKREPELFAHWKFGILPTAV